MKDSFSTFSREETPSSSFWNEAFSYFKKNKAAMTGAIGLILLFLFSVFGPIISSYSYYQTDLPMKNQAPSWQHWFGTDDLGRDLFVRVWTGARISLFVGITAAFIDLMIGVIYGGIAALSGGKVDDIMMRLADILYAIPYLLVVILFTVFLGSGLLPIIIALTLTGWIAMARIVRSQFIQLKEQEFVQAAISYGAGKKRILFNHFIPNALGTILVTVTLTIPTAIFTEAFLSFLGLGIQAPMASWGTMANDGLPALRYYPWRLFFPAFFISLTMLSFNLVGDGLRDALDPKKGLKK